MTLINFVLNYTYILSVSASMRFNEDKFIKEVERGDKRIILLNGENKVFGPKI